MKYFLWSIFLSLLFYQPAAGQEHLNPDRQLYQKNKVKEVKLITYRLRKGKPVGKGRLLSLTRVDTTGRKTAVWSYAASSSGFLFEYTYDEHGELFTHTGYVNATPVVDTFYYQYDRLGRVVEIRKSGNGGYWQYSYDSIGNRYLVQWYWYGLSDTYAYFSDIYAFDSQGYPSQMTRHYANGGVYFRFLYSYDSNGNLTEEIRVERRDTTDIRSFTYDLAGNCIRFSNLDYRTREVVAWSESDYSSNGLLLSSKGKLSFERKPYYRKVEYVFYE